MKKLLHDEEGAQIIEYALVIAVVSIGLVIALQALPVSATQGIASLASRIVDCLSGNGCS
ncbi:MAG: Flp family type IVb pilin [Proteobacteria bacterium]|nr:Flp family type IVb pilin [Pseudomonadota bacterium]